MAYSKSLSIFAYRPTGNVAVTCSYLMVVAQHATEILVHF